MMRFTLSKQERLSSEKEIEALFLSGNTLTKYPVRLIFLEESSPGTFPVRVMFSVSKKKFPRAVDRNRIKRLLRESYRLLKPQLYRALPPAKSFQVGLVFTGNEIPDFESIQKAVSKAFDRLVIQTQPE